MRRVPLRKCEVDQGYLLSYQGHLATRSGGPELLDKRRDLCKYVEQTSPEVLTFCELLGFRSAVVEVLKARLGFHTNSLAVKIASRGSSCNAAR